MDKAPHWRNAADPLTEQAKPTLAAVREDLARVPLARRIVTIVFVLFAIFIARSSWDLEIAGRDIPGVKAFMRNAERALYDTRSLTASLRKPVEQDQRIILVPFTPDTQRTTGERSPLDRTTLANALTNIDKMGAKSIGIDILIDQAQPDDPLLVKALHDMKTPVWLGFATNAHNSFDVDVWQQEFMANFVKQIGNPNVRKTSIRLEADNDNVMRNWPAQYRDLPPFMPVAMTGMTRAENYRGSVLYRAPVRLRHAGPARGLHQPADRSLATPEGAAMLGNEVKGKYVLIGGDLPDLDQFDTPASLLSNEPTTGLKIHATMIAQLLDGRLPGRVNSVALWIVAFFVVLCGTFTSMIDIRPGYLTLFDHGATGLLLRRTVPVRASGHRYAGPARRRLGCRLAARLHGVGAAARAMGSDQRRFAQSALGKYLPPGRRAQIMSDPDELRCTASRLPLYALFTDLEGFTKLRPSDHAGDVSRCSTAIST